MIEKIDLMITRRDLNSLEIDIRQYRLSELDGSDHRIVIGSENSNIEMPPEFGQFRATIYTANEVLYYVQHETESRSFMLENGTWERLTPNRDQELTRGSHLRLGPRLSVAKKRLDIQVLDIKYS
ncbi:hypothetical protein HYV86_02580 [Candidatus Woesearchaeota archaeon]|nr:hypothetical protein [Candidatus Woesearchaeota archaeon]